MGYWPWAIHKVHEMRHECMSIMVGVDTVIADDPSNCRIEDGRNPVRIVIEQQAQNSSECQLVRTADECDNDSCRCAIEGHL